MNPSRSLGSTISRIRAAFLLTLTPAGVMAAEAVSQSPDDAWSWIISLFVISVAASVAYLCYGAVQLWEGYWRILAIAPLAILALWTCTLLVPMLTSSVVRTLWSFELLFWAMVTTVYLVVLFTARRTFEKAAAEENRR